jgi:hypothetical protein
MESTGQVESAPSLLAKWAEPRFVVLFEMPGHLVGAADGQPQWFRGAPTDLVSAVHVANRLGGHCLAFIQPALPFVLDSFAEMPGSENVQKGLIAQPVRPVPLSRVFSRLQHLN